MSSITCACVCVCVCLRNTRAGETKRGREGKRLWSVVWHVGMISVIYDDAHKGLKASLIFILLFYKSILGMLTSSAFILLTSRNHADQKLPNHFQFWSIVYKNVNFMWRPMLTSFQNALYALLLSFYDLCLVRFWCYKLYTYSSLFV